MKKLLILGLLISQLVANSIEIKLDENLSSEIFETIDLVYKNTDEMRYNSLYIESILYPEYELTFTVDSKNTESDYTMMFLRKVNARVADKNIFRLYIDRNKNILILQDYSLLTKEEILLKQYTILKIVREYKEELNRKYKIKLNKIDNSKRNFIELR